MEFIATIYFAADSESAALALMESWGLPEGARVTAQASAQPVSTVVGAGGSLTTPEPPAPPEHVHLPADTPDEPPADEPDEPTP
jgi:hypothetical protein